MNIVDLLLRQKPAIKILALVLILGAILGVYWQFFYRPVVAEIRVIEPELNKLKAELSAKRDIVKEKPRYEAELEETRAKLHLALKQLPNKSEIPTLESLNLPPILKRCAEAPAGVVIISGTTSSGKSTTLAALVGLINNNFERRIITIEDPIEYEFTDAKSTITQREVGLDTRSFATGLRQVLRQDPDVILIGEVRDAESLRIGLMAAETGHLVLTTLHSGTAAQAIPRLLNEFPADDQDRIRLAVAANLHSVICQRLIPTAQGGLVPAVEILFNTPMVRKLIVQNQLDHLHDAIETGNEDGLQTFDQAIYQLIRQHVVTERVGLEHATNAEKLRMNLEGIFLDESRRILATN